jgi:transposase
VDTQGLLLRVKVHAASISDRDGGKLVLEQFSEPRLKELFPRLHHLWLDGGYRGEFEEWVEKVLGWSVEVVKHKRKGDAQVLIPEGEWMLGEVVIDWSVIEPPPELVAQYGSGPKGGGFRLLARRWVVERTFGWLSWYRRLSKDYEYLPESSEAVVYAAMSRLMVRRLRKLTLCQHPYLKLL